MLSSMMSSLNLFMLYHINWYSNYKIEFLINDVCIKNNQLSDETIDEISKLFPNATFLKEI